MRHALGLSASLALLSTACAPVEAPPGAPVASSDHQIIDGAPARADQMRSTLALIDPGSGAFFCTGTLVQPTVVITAAHCLMTPDQAGFIQADDAQVGVGVLDARAVPQNKRVDIARFTVHPNFAQNPQSDDPSSLGQDDDIAVLVLARPVDGLPVTPILPADRLDELVGGTSLVISGYGVNDLRSDAAGVLHIGQTSVVRSSAHEVLAGGGDDADTCFGDSGGPAYLDVGGRSYLVGATSRGANDAPVDCGDRGIYTLVPAYHAWIDEVVAGGPAANAPAPDLGGGGDWGEDDWGDEGWGDEEWDEGEWGDEDWGDDGEPSADVCAEEGFYGDDICDPWCDEHDIDCGEAPADAPDEEPAPEQPADDEAVDEAPADEEPADDVFDDGADTDPEAGERPDTPVEPVDPEPEAGDAQDDTPLVGELPAAEQEAPADGGGCSATGVGSSGGPGWVAMLGLVLVGLRRRITVTS